MVEQRALPVLQGWYARLRREGDIPGACQVATHIAFVCGGILEWGGELPTTPHGEIAGDHGEIAPEIATSQRQIFGLLSTRVYLNVNHPFATDPPDSLSAAAASSSSSATTMAAAAKSVWPLGRKGQGARDAGGGEAEGGEALGFEELEVFDLWQRHLGSTLSWLEQRPTQRSEVLEAIVRLLSGEPTAPVGGEWPSPSASPSPSPSPSPTCNANPKPDPQRRPTLTLTLTGRRWVALPQLGCGGRYVPEVSGSIRGRGRARPPAPSPSPVPLAVALALVLALPLLLSLPRRRPPSIMRARRPLLPPPPPLSSRAPTEASASGCAGTCAMRLPPRSTFTWATSHSTSTT